MNDIYKLTLHENIQIQTNGIEYMITRVPGGWLYNHIRLDKGQMQQTFVPFNNEFQP